MRSSAKALFIISLASAWFGCGGHGSHDLGGGDDLAGGGTLDLSAPADDLAGVVDAATPADLATSVVDLASADLVYVDPCASTSSGSGIAIVGAAPFGMTTGTFIAPNAGATFGQASGAATILVSFSVPFDAADATTLTNYVISPALAVTNAVMTDAQTIKLTTAAQTPDQAYTVTVSNVRDSTDAAMFPTAILPFDGYRYHLNAYRTGPKTMGVFFYDSTVACATAQTIANYSVAGATIVSAKGSGCGGGRAAFATLTFAEGISSGKHALVANAALTDTLGNPPSPLTVSFDGPGDPSPLNVWSVDVTGSTVTPTFNVDVDPTTGATAADYTTTPAVAIGGALVLASPNDNQVMLSASTTANTRYTLATSGVLPVIGGAAPTIPSTAFWGYGSFYPIDILALSPTSIRVYFSDTVGASAGLTGSYAISGGVTVQMVNASSLAAVLTVSPMTGNTDYTITMSGISSATAVPLATGYGDAVDVSLDAAVDANALPHAYLGKVQLDVDYGISASADGKHLFVSTSPLPSGAYTLRLCGLKDAAHTTSIGSTTVDFTVP